MFVVISKGAAAVIGGVLSAGASIFGANKAADVASDTSAAAQQAASQVADKQIASAEKIAEEQRKLYEATTYKQMDAAERQMSIARSQYEQQRADQAPYLQMGTNNLGYLQNMISSPRSGDITSFMPADLTTDPLYKNAYAAASRQEMQQAAGSGQSTRSGALQTRLGQLGETIYQNTYQNRYTAASDAYKNKYQQLVDAIKIGQGAIGTLAQSSSNYANATGNALSGMSSAIGAGAANQQQALSGLSTNIGTALGTQGTAIGDALYASGNAQSELYAGMGKSLSSGLNTGLNLYNAVNKSGGSGFNTATSIL